MGSFLWLHSEVAKLDALEGLSSASPEQWDADHAAPTTVLGGREACESTLNESDVPRQQPSPDTPR